MHGRRLRAPATRTGGGGLITDGATQWMTAGAGILHIELPPEELITKGGLFHGVQLWVNLPQRAQVDAAALPGHRRRRRHAALRRRRRRARPGDRRRARRARRARARPSRRSPTCTRRSRPGATARRCRGRRDFNALVYVLVGRGDVGRRARGRSTRASSPCSAPATR